MQVQDSVGDPAIIDTALDSRSISFENLTGARGAGGTAHGGRKGAPNRITKPGDEITLADIQGPGRIGHFWITVPPLPPQEMRRLILEVTYDGREAPSISVPLVDFFGCPHGRPVPLNTAYTTIQEGRGYNSWLPMPFRDNIRITFRNQSNRTFPLYYQVDYNLAPQAEDTGLLHVSFARENTTTLGQDFTIAQGFKGPGRFMGCNIGVRVLNDILMQKHFSWYGEGEVKIFRDGDEKLPTICGTGFEDYAGTAWGMGAHQTPFAGVPHDVRNPDGSGGANPDFASLYRWHGPDPIIFQNEVRVTVQQIGAVFLGRGQEDLLKEIEKQNPVAGEGWRTSLPAPAYAFGICERVDDVCATAYLYLQQAQDVPRVDAKAAAQDLERKPYEHPSPLEIAMGGVGAFSEEG